MGGLVNMDNLSKFESRVGKIQSNSKAVYTFLNDMRNFEQFLPEGKVDNWLAEEDNCSFSVSPVGEAKIRIVDREPYIQLKYEGNGLNNTNFWLWVQLKELSDNDTRVKITLKADIKPMIKMMASGPLKDFLEKLVKGMEEFTAW